MPSREMRHYRQPWKIDSPNSETNCWGFISWPLNQGIHFLIGMWRQKSFSLDTPKPYFQRCTWRLPAEVDDSLIGERERANLMVRTVSSYIIIIIYDVRRPIAHAPGLRASFYPKRFKNLTCCLHACDDVHARNPGACAIGRRTVVLGERSEPT